MILRSVLRGVCLRVQRQHALAAVAAVGSHARVASPNLLPVSLSACAGAALATARSFSTAAVRVDAAATRAETLQTYTAMLSALQSDERRVAGETTAGPFTWWAVLDPCAAPSKSALRSQVYASLAFGAKGLWASTTSGSGGAAAECSMSEFSAMASINRMVTRVGNLLLGLRVETLFTSAPALLADRALPFVAPSAGSLVQAMDADLIVSVLVPVTANATTPPVLLVLDARDPSTSPKGTRTALLKLAPSVAAVRPISDAGYVPMGAAGAFCDKGWKGSETAVRNIFRNAPSSRAVCS